MVFILLRKDPRSGKENLGKGKEHRFSKSDLDSNPNTIIYLFCDLEEVLRPLWFPIVLKSKYLLQDDVFQPNVKILRKCMAHRRHKDITVIFVIRMIFIIIIILARIEKTRQSLIARSFII